MTVPAGLPFAEVANADACNPSNKSAFKFVTTVVDATVKGAVPVAWVEVKVVARATPTTSSGVPGVAEAIPTFPLASIKKGVVSFATSSTRKAGAVPVCKTCSSARGDVGTNTNIAVRIKGHLVRIICAQRQCIGSWSADESIAS